MFDIYCPHCQSRQTICPSKLSSDNILPNTEINAIGGICGFMECSICYQEIGFEIYPPFTKNPYGISLEVYKKRDDD
jgi:hypothetical protein